MDKERDDRSRYRETISKLLSGIYCSDDETLDTSAPLFSTPKPSKGHTSTIKWRDLSCESESEVETFNSF